VMNIASGGRGRLSTFVSGAFLLFLLVAAGEWVGRVPMAALVAVMIMVSIGTFSWSSIRNLKTYPKSSSVVMIATVIVVVFTHDLAMGVFVGVLLSALFFARKVALLMRIRSYLSDDKLHQTYVVEGQLFFASAERFYTSFDFKNVLEKVTIDVSGAHFWDLSAVGALDRVILKFRREGAEVELIGLNKASETLVDQLAIHDKPDALELMLKH